MSVVFAIRPQQPEQTKTEKRCQDLVEQNEIFHNDIAMGIHYCR